MKEETKKQKQKAILERINILVEGVIVAFGIYGFVKLYSFFGNFEINEFMEMFSFSSFQYILLGVYGAIIIVLITDIVTKIIKNLKEKK